MVKSSITLSSQPDSVAVGDLNNDNRMDIVVGNSGTNTIGIFLSNVDGAFANQKTYSTGSYSHPYSIVVGHLNKDNYLDIAVANYGANNIGIFVGHGNGSFASQQVFSTGSSHPLFITIGDFNNDNQSDIAVANYGTNDIGVLLGYGDGSFQIQITHFIGYDSIPYSLAVGDFNKDNRLDIALTNYGTNNIGILLGYGNGSFANQTTYTTNPNSNPSSIAVGDLNNDNQSDIVIANHGAGNIGILLGYRNGTFAAQTTFSISSNSHPQYIAVGDFEKDNQLDVIVVDSINAQVHVLLGYANAAFTTITTYDGIPESSPLLVAIADFNNDNQSDIVVVNNSTNNMLVLIGYSIKPSARQTNYLVKVGSIPTALALGDINNDNHLDIVVDNISTDSVLILIGLVNGSFTIGATYSTGNNSSPHGVRIGDLNNDNRMDIVTANYGSDSFGVLLGQGNGTFANVTTYSAGIGSAPRSIAIGDLNNDTQLDIVTGNYGSNSVGVFFGLGNGIFVNMTTYSSGNNSSPFSVAVGDVNNDNHLDIVTANIGSDSVGILLGQDRGTFSIVMTYPIGSFSYPTSVALADFNSDNRLDIAVATLEGGFAGVLLGYGNGSFKDVMTYPTGATSSLYSIAVADFNNDNLYDFIVTDVANDQVILFFGDGIGNFQLSRTYSTGSGSGPYQVTTADLMNNNETDIIVTLWGSRNVGILTPYYAAMFANQTTYSTGSAPQPYSLAIGDFNKDSHSDIAVVNSGTDNLGVLFGLSNGTFGTEILYFIGTDSRPQYVITVDVNKDNLLDIVTANSKNDSISVFMGYGNGSFAAQTMYSTGDGSHPSAVILGDFNNDNRSDFAVANEGTDSIGILLGYNYASFQSQNTYSNVNNLAAYGIVVKDFNNDSYLDIAVTFFKSGNIAILLGYGNGSFGTMISYSTGIGSIPWAIAVDDFNRDGQLDMAVANSGTSNIGVLLGYGNGSFATMMPYSTGAGSQPYAVATNDLNNDGRLDLVVANGGTNNVGILLGYNNGTFGTIVTFPTGDGSTPQSVTVVDFNNDDKLDMVVANYGTSNIGIFLGYGNGSFESQVTYSTGDQSWPFHATVGNFNGDDGLDVATANYYSNNVGIFLGYGNGSFATFTAYTTGDGSSPTSVSIGDFNNDNISDIAVTNYGANNIVVLFGFGDGSFLLGTSYQTGMGSEPNSLAIGDFNKDMRLDVAVANYLSNNICIFLGYGNQPFAGVTTYSTGTESQPHSIAVGDFNHDGQSDIVVANYGTDNVGILLGYNNKGFNIIMTYSTGVGSAPYSVAISDFNNDKQLDIVVTNSGTDNVAIFFGNGNGTFGNSTIYSTGIRSSPYTVAISDFNNDKISDIAIANSGISNIFLLYGHWNGTFGDETSYPLGYGYSPYSLAVKDLNQDGWVDIAIACYGTDNIETLVKMC